MTSPAIPDRSAFLDALRATLPPADIAIGDDAPARNSNDWSGLPGVAPIAVIRPRDAAGVSAALRLCAAHGVPVTPQGGLTGLCGASIPIAGGVALSMERMVGIEEIDPDAMTITVRAGTPLQTIQNAARDAGFMIPLDLGARGSCAIGGNISTNAGG
ncbi:MAG: FAD/FMN-containing dehydrogenase, partial [Paracoccaceae bacterium]